jgi:hypothetical protein
MPIHTIAPITAGIVVILVGIMCYMAFKVTRLFGDKKPGWFAVLPFLMLYGLIIRIGVFLITINVLPLEADYYLTTFATLFWVGLTAFMYGLYTIAQEIIDR